LGKKWTIEIVREGFEADGYELLTIEYINNHQKLDYICPKQRKGQVTWHHWLMGSRCPCCSGILKKTIDFIRSEFEKEGYKLLTKKYINNSQKLDYICPKGHRYYITWGNWQQGRRCPCFAGRPPINIDSVKFEFNKRGYELLSKKYINARSNLKFKCKRGHIGKMSWDNFSHGSICLKCAIENNTGPGHPSWKGGISKEPYCKDWDKDLKEFVKERDGYKCMNPDCWEKDNVLHVHHINYNKKSCGAENLTTVCRSCNGRANKDREWHEAWYKAILHKRYNYIY